MTHLSSWALNFSVLAKWRLVAVFRSLKPNLSRLDRQVQVLNHHPEAFQCPSKTLVRFAHPLMMGVFSCLPLEKMGHSSRCREVVLAWLLLLVVESNRISYIFVTFGGNQTEIYSNLPLLLSDREKGFFICCLAEIGMSGGSVLLRGWICSEKTFGIR